MHERIGVIGAVVLQIHRIVYVVDRSIIVSDFFFGEICGLKNEEHADMVHIYNRCICRPHDV